MAAHQAPHPWDSPDKNTGVGCHFLPRCMIVKSKNEVAQSCLTLRNPMDYSLPGSSIHGIFQVRVLEWVAIAFSSYNVCVCVCVCIYIYKYNYILLYNGRLAWLQMYITNPKTTTKLISKRGTNK